MSSSSSSPTPVSPSSSASPPPTAQPNATSSAPTPPAVTAPPPSLAPPPSTPASPPPVVSTLPPTAANAPPPASPSPPPLIVLSPPPSAPLSPPVAPAPPPASLPSLPPPSPPPPTPTTSPPPVTVPPSSPANPGSPPPAQVTAPPKSPSQPSPSANPPVGSPPSPITLSPPPSNSQTPPNPSAPPPNDSPPSNPSPANPGSPPPAPVTAPPKSPSQPSPSANPPVGSPPSPITLSPPPSNPQTPPNPSAPPPNDSPPSNPSAPPPKSRPPSVPSPPPSNSSGGMTPVTPSVPSPPTNQSSDFSPNATAGTGGSNSAGGSGISAGTAVAIAVVTGLVVLSLVGVAVWFVKKKHRKQTDGYNTGFVMPSPLTSSQMSESSYPRSPDPLIPSSGSHEYINSPLNPGFGNSKLLFTYEDLYKITNGFSVNNLLGEGGFGCVYKGCLPDGREVAVKQLKVGGGQGEREFQAEVETISRVHHRHLVSLVGYCVAQNQRLLVYDFVPNNTLHYHLHEQGSTVMDWATRVKVAADAARGIAYLHEDCHPRIIHRDIKSSNILLDNNYEAQVSDFGLAKLAIDAATHVTTRVMGTFGYMAPEYASTGKLTDRSDVYSFGVVLLELITGRKPVDQSQPLGDESLVEWARPLLTRALDTGDHEALPDPRLEKNYNEPQMLRMIEVAAVCVRHSASMRPKMGLVVRALDSLTESDLNNGIVPGRSELFAAPASTELRMFQRMAFGNQDYSIDFSNNSGASRDEL